MNNHYPSPSFDEQTASLLTPQGRGAISTIRLNGDCRFIDAATPSLFHATNSKPLGDQPIGRVLFGRWGSYIKEDIVVCRIDEHTTEIHCHGGDAAAARILGDLEALGCRIETWQQLMATLGGRFDAEALEALTRASTSRVADILLEQQSGLLRSAIGEIRDRLSHWLVEPENDRKTQSSPLPQRGGTNGETAPESDTVCQDIACQDIADRIDALLGWSDFGLHLTAPWSVVLAGRPNVGKSSLINVLVGFARSIVYDRPGTTRDVVTVETAFDGWPVQLSDTAGIYQAAEPLESAGIDRARSTLAATDCRILLIDTSRPPHEDDHRLLQAWPGAILVAHKCDLPNIWGAEIPTGAFPVSSLTGEGIEALAEILLAALIPKIPDPGTPIPFTQRQVNLLEQAREALGQNAKATCLAVLDECLG